jgi:hypothetical protein
MRLQPRHCTRVDADERRLCAVLGVAKRAPEAAIRVAFRHRNPESLGDLARILTRVASARPMRGPYPRRESCRNGSFALLPWNAVVLKIGLQNEQAQRLRRRTRRDRPEKASQPSGAQIPRLP